MAFWLAACARSAPAWSVDVEPGWVRSDVTQNRISQATFPGAVQVVGLRPQGATVFYQHAIAVLPARRAQVLPALRERQLTKNQVLASEGSTQLPAGTAQTLVFANRVDPTNQQTFHLLEHDSHTVVLQLHAPTSAATNQSAADRVVASFRFDDAD